MGRLPLLLVQHLTFRSVGSAYILYLAVLLTTSILSG